MWVHILVFDTFWLHTFNIYDKNSHILLRPGYSEHYNDQVKNYVAIPFSAAKSKVIFIYE